MSDEIQNLCFDLYDEMERVWKKEFPDGKLPDGVAANIALLPRIFYSELSAAKRESKISD